MGPGSIATTAIAPAIRWSSNGFLHAVASRSDAVAHDKAHAMGASRAYANYESLLDDPKVEAVYIGLPNGLHEEWALRAAKAGKHVLCEKSAALGAAAVERMAAAFASKGLRFVEAFMYRHHPQWNAVRGLLAERALGDLRLVRASLCGSVEKPDDHRWSKSLGGGALYDVACYAIDVARFVVGEEPSAVCATLDTATEEGVSRTCAALLEFPGGVVASTAGSLVASAEQNLVVVGSRATLTVPKPFVLGWDRTVLVVDENGKRRTVDVGGANHFLHQVEHFARLVAEPEHPAAPAEDGTGNAWVLDAVQRSHAEGRKIRRAVTS
ncbi:MAG: Gfo/Idh/MocA family oxidoreductase [Polyangiaceae bacterium]